MADIFATAEDLVAQGDLKQAIVNYGDLSSDMQHGAAALVRRAGLLRERGEITEAEADLEKAVALDPGSPWPRMRLGQLYGASGRNIAEALIKQSGLDRDPNNFEMRVNAGAAYVQIEWLDLAYRAVRGLPEGLPDWWAGARRNALTRYVRQVSETRQLLQTRRAATDRNLRQWELTQKLFTLGRLSLARKLCEGLMHDNPRSFPAFFFCSRIIARQEGVPAAVAFLRSVAWLHARDPDYAYALARVLHEVGDYAAVLDLTRHGRVEEEPEELRYIKAVAMLILGRGDDLRLYCRDWMRNSPKSVPPAGFVTATHFRESSAPQAEAKASSEVEIVQFWDTPAIPADVAEVMASWTHFHSATTRRVFNEEEARAFLQDHFGSDVRATFDACHHAAMKADYFRIAYLLQRGGVWIDADERCLRPMDHVLVPGIASELTAALSGDTPGYLHNFILASRAGSEIMRLAFEDADASIVTAVREGTRPDIWQVTGPGLITRAAAAHLVGSDRAQRAGAVILMPLHQYRVLARTEGSLEYKRRPSGNWQLA